MEFFIANNAVAVKKVVVRLADSAVRLIFTSEAVCCANVAFRSAYHLTWLVAFNANPLGNKVIVTDLANIAGSRRPASGAVL